MSVELEVELDGDSRCIYSSGDKVSGRVIVTSSSQEAVKHLKINFRGICKTLTTPYPAGGNQSMTPRRPIQESISLFDQEKVLFERPYKLAPSRHEWLFEFTFPSRSETVYRKRVNTKYFNKQTHVLPPSCHCFTDATESEGRVRYGIDAVLVRGHFKPEIRTSRDLEFRAKGTYPEPATPLAYVLETQREGKKKLRRSVISRKLGRAWCFRRNKRRPPIILEFVPTIHAPCAVAPGQGLDVGLSFNPITREDGLPRNDFFNIDHIKVELSSHTRIRLGGTLSKAHDVAIRKMTCVDCKNTNILVPADNTPFALLRAFRLPDDDDVLPTFRSYAMSRIYHISVSVSLHWQGRPFSFESNTEVEILPRYIPPTDAPARLSLVVQDLVDMDDLPPYTVGDFVPGAHNPEFKEESRITTDDPELERPESRGSTISTASYETAASSNGTLPSDFSDGFEDAEMASDDEDIMGYVQKPASQGNVGDTKDEGIAGAIIAQTDDKSDMEEETSNGIELNPTSDTISLISTQPDEEHDEIQDEQISKDQDFDNHNKGENTDTTPLLSRMQTLPDDAECFRERFRLALRRMPASAA